MTDARPILEARRVNSGYGRKQVLYGVVLGIRPGEITGLVGPNGSGKSTVLRVLAGSLPAWSGSVVYEGRDIGRKPAHWRAQHGIGLLLPDGQVFTSMSVSQNLRLAHMLSGGRGQPTDTLLDEAFATFPALRDKASRRAGLLSGGERQMLAVALVLAQRPRVLLLDEPVEGLAEDVALRVMEAIQAYVRATAAAALLVEHNTTIVLDRCTHVHFLSQGQMVAELSCADADIAQRLTDLYFTH